ncbi:MAG: T9SS type A sorting domain-containing protein [Bacteroidota bacterium]
MNLDDRYDPNGQNLSYDSCLNEILIAYQTVYYDLAYPQSTSQATANCYEIRIQDTSRYDSLYLALLQKDIFEFLIIQEPILAGPDSNLTSQDVQIQDASIRLAVNARSHILTLVQISNPKPLEILLLNIQGKKMYQSILTSSTSMIDLHSFASGVYIVQVREKRQLIHAQKILRP